jgi:hypothetical protein
MNNLIEIKVRIQKRIKKFYEKHPTIKIGYINKKTNIFKINFLNSHIMLVVSFPNENKNFYCETVLFDNNKNKLFEYNYDVFECEEDLINEIERIDILAKMYMNN